MSKKKLPIVAFSIHPWDEPQWMNRQQLLSRLAKRGWPVYYCTGALDWWSRGGDGWNSAGYRVNSYSLDGVTIIEAGKLTPTWQRSKILSNWSINRYCNSIKRLVGMEGDNFIGLIFHPAFEPYFNVLKPKYVHFHAYDLYWKMGKWDDADDASLKKLTGYCDLITATSQTVKDELFDLVSVEAKLLLNGADIEKFGAVFDSVPYDLVDIPHPRIANIGTLNGKMDLVTIESVAKVRPKWHWVFVGRVAEQELLMDEYNKAAYLSLKELPNIHFLGEKHRSLMPEYVGNMDVLTIVYKTGKDSWAYGGFPLKLVEYLASGLPVISSPLLVIKQFFSEVVLQADDKEQWIDSINSALQNSDSGIKNKRSTVALGHSWDKRVDQLENDYLKMIEGSG